FGRWKKLRSLSTARTSAVTYCSEPRHLCSYLRRTREEISRMAGWLSASEVNFVRLQTATFCVECELISENNTPYCIACGSKGILSLSRVLGGSLKQHQTAHVIADAELDRLVRAL